MLPQHAPRKVFFTGQQGTTTDWLCQVNRNSAPSASTFMRMLSLYIITTLSWPWSIGHPWSTATASWVPDGFILFWPSAALGQIKPSPPDLSCCCWHVFPAEFQVSSSHSNCTLSTSPCLPWSPCLVVSTSFHAPPSLVALSYMLHSPTNGASCFSGYAYTDLISTYQLLLPGVG